MQGGKGSAGMSTLQETSDSNPGIPVEMVEQMLKKTKCLCSLIDPSMVEEVFGFLEMTRITVKPEQVQKGVGKHKDRSSKFSIYNNW